MNDDVIEFVLKLGQALHRHGAASPRVELVMGLVCEKFGLEAQLFAEPTSIVASFGRAPHQNTSLLRVEPGSPHLANRCRLDEIANAVLSDQLSPAAGTQALLALESSTKPLSAWLTAFAFTVASGAAARFFGANLLEQGLAAALGLLTGLLAITSRHIRADRVFEPFAAAVAALGAMVAAVHFPVSSYTLTVSALIVLLPGLSFTTAVTELALRHLASGTSRLMGSFLSFLGLGFGVAIGRRAGELLPSPLPDPPALAPDWTFPLALILGPISYAILLRSRLRDIPWIVLAGVVAVVGSRAGIHLLGPEIGAFLGAFIVGSSSNLWGRLLHRPSLVVRLPGILMLVPGSVGFRSFAALLDRDVLGGIETGFQMTLIAISLVSGLILANVLVAPRNLDASET